MQKYYFICNKYSYIITIESPESEYFLVSRSIDSRNPIQNTAAISLTENKYYIFGGGDYMWVPDDDVTEAMYDCLSINWDSIKKFSKVASDSIPLYRRMDLTSIHSNIYKHIVLKNVQFLNSKINIVVYENEQLSEPHFHIEFINSNRLDIPIKILKPEYCLDKAHTKVVDLSEEELIVLNIILSSHSDKSKYSNWEVILDYWWRGINNCNVRFKNFRRQPNYMKIRRS